MPYNLVILGLFNIFLLTYEGNMLKLYNNKVNNGKLPL